MQLGMAVHLPTGTHEHPISYDASVTAATGTEDKELYTVAGATHVDLYWRPGMVDDALAKLSSFFKERI